MSDNTFAWLFGTTFLGIETGQCWADIAAWEVFLSEHSDIETIIELGTGTGGFALFLLMHQYQRGKAFHTFDLWQPVALDCLVAICMRLNEHCHQGDIFQDECKEVLQLLSAAQRPLLLMCDNGHKAHELQNFVPHLQPGDYVSVHDWGTEVRDEDIVSIVHLLQPMQFMSDQEASRTRVWQRIQGEV